MLSLSRIKSTQLKNRKVPITLCETFEGLSVDVVAIFIHFIVLNVKLVSIDCDSANHLSYEQLKELRERSSFESLGRFIDSSILN